MTNTERGTMKTITAGELNMNHWDSEVRFTDRFGTTHQGTIADLAHYMHPELQSEEGVMPRTTSVRLVGRTQAVFLLPDVQVIVAGDES